MYVLPHMHNQFDPLTPCEAARHTKLGCTQRGGPAHRDTDRFGSPFPRVLFRRKAQHHVLGGKMRGKIQPVLVGHLFFLTVYLLGTGGGGTAWVGLNRGPHSPTDVP